MAKQKTNKIKEDLTKIEVDEKETERLDKNVETENNTPTPNNTNDGELEEYQSKLPKINVRFNQ